MKPIAGSIDGPLRSRKQVGYGKTSRSAFHQFTLIAEPVVEIPKGDTSVKSNGSTLVTQHNTTHQEPQATETRDSSGSFNSASQVSSSAPSQRTGSDEDQSAGRKRRRLSPSPAFSASSSLFDFDGDERPIESKSHERARSKPVSRLRGTAEPAALVSRKPSRKPSETQTTSRIARSHTRAASEELPRSSAAVASLHASNVAHSPSRQTHPQVAASLDSTIRDELKLQIRSPRATEALSQPFSSDLVGPSGTSPEAPKKAGARTKQQIFALRKQEQSPVAERTMHEPQSLPNQASAPSAHLSRDESLKRISSGTSRITGSASAIRQPTIPPSNPQFSSPRAPTPEPLSPILVCSQGSEFSARPLSSSKHGGPVNGLDASMDICETIDLVSEYSDDYLPSTPPRQVLSPECLIKDSDLVSATPRQRELWTNLLQSPAPSMSVQRSGARRALAGISLGERDQRTGDSSSNSVRRQLFSSPSSAQTLQASQRLVDALGHASRPTEVSAVDADPGTPRRIIAKPRGARAAALRRHSRASSLDQEPIAQPAVVEPVHVTKPSLVRENPINSQAIGARITYAGARSILPDSTMVASDLAMPSLPSIEEELSQPFAHSSGEGIERPADSSDEEDATCAIQSIHALREAGVNNRFLDEANGLLEDIESEGRTSISRRRSAMMTLASKVLDKNYAHKFVLASLDGRVFKAVHPNEDLITLSAQSVVLSSLLANGSSSHDTDSSDLMKQNVDILRALRESASLHTIAKQRKSNMSNMGQKIVADFEAQLLKSSFWPRPLPHVSPRLALLRYIELYVRRAREARVTDAVLPPDVVREIVDHPAAPAATVPQNNLEYHLTSSILEAWSLALGQAEINIDDPTARNYIDVSSLGPRSQAIIGSSTCSAPPTAQHPTDPVSEELLLTLRMMLNLTNGRPKICHALGTLPYISALTSLIEHFFTTITSSCTLPQATLASQTRPLDALVLALGLLTNFAEQPASHTPYLTPALPSGASNLTRLLAVYAAQAALVPNRTTLEASGVNVAFGYLAVVVGNLCLVPEIATRARAELEGKAGLLSERGHEMVVEKEGEGDEGLKGLLGHVREFIAMHRRMDEQAGAVLAGSGDADVEDGQDGGMVDAGRVGSGKDGKDGFTQNMEAFVRRMESSCEFR